MWSGEQGRPIVTIPHDIICSNLIDIISTTQTLVILFKNGMYLMILNIS